VDINLVRGLLTAALFALFVGLCVWAWSDRRRADFESAAQIPLEGDADGPLTEEERC
jgi:cytochrome c oxidase cbb3-type subunit 4